MIDCVYLSRPQGSYMYGFTYAYAYARTNLAVTFYQVSWYKPVSLYKVVIDDPSIYVIKPTIAQLSDWPCLNVNVNYLYYWRVITPWLV
jgi:hypothetical protein